MTGLLSRMIQSVMQIMELIKMVTTALIYLLENVTINPYERIAMHSGHGILDCVEFFFGVNDEENNKGSYDGEDKDYPMLDVADDEFMRLLQQ